MKAEAGNQPHLGGREKLLLLGPPQPGPWAAPPDGCNEPPVQETERGLSSRRRLGRGRVSPPRLDVRA